MHLHKIMAAPLLTFGGFAVALIVSDWNGPATAQKKSTTNQVPTRQVPVPTTVSSELQKVIAGPVRTVLAPKSPKAWRTLQKISDRANAVQAHTLATQLGVTVKKKKVNGVKCYTVVPRTVSAQNKDRLYVHVHGGAYVFGSGLAGTREAIQVAAACKARVLSVDYRMPPDHPFPAALDDSVAVWREVVKNQDPRRLALFGTSTGGGLSLATLLKLKEQNLPLPGAVFLGTPWTDLTKTGDSYFLNAGIDRVLARYEGILEGAAKLYADKADLKSPFLSPVYGDMHGLPPTVLISGTRDLFLSNTVRVHRKLRAASVPAELHVYEGQSHADYLLPSVPETRDALQEVCQFFNKHLKR